MNSCPRRRADALCRQNELDGALAVVRELHNVFEFLEDERRALVGRDRAQNRSSTRRDEQLIEGDEVSRRQPLPGGAGGGGRIRSVPGATGNATPQLRITDKLRIGHAFPNSGEFTSRSHELVNCRCQSCRLPGRALGRSRSGAQFASQNRRTGPFIQRAGECHW